MIIIIQCLDVQLLQRCRQHSCRGIYFTQNMQNFTHQMASLFLFLLLFKKGDQQLKKYVEVYENFIGNSQSQVGNCQFLGSTQLVGYFIYFHLYSYFHRLHKLNRIQQILNMLFLTYRTICTITTISD
ncbi:unnamed protein product (macronuclear) [Paramecium tetraurelia]|uniref:Transmembrane protein n=1 Tax=Paramecium tetraurelia TaxID=5888 RepID=A0BZ79_PARTE|nr:uncharacterized protein GSPATT00033699001 [Paramecium tetraurelia]CAK63846.1 unnamed protein product [Paramecium tetraurelia]|eukprot:XP_001431244.1 hypothetical protein (macronuclear) [Paramecium tetraurelia strain d4-2]